MQLTRPASEAVALECIERELTLLVRRAQKVNLTRILPNETLDRAAYAILGRLHERGPQRPGSLAAHFNLDASTISRQVATLKRDGLIEQHTDGNDRRAFRLRLTEFGATVLLAARAERHRILREMLRAWSPEDVTTFATMLTAFNTDLERLLQLGSGPDEDTDR